MAGVECFHKISLDCFEGGRVWRRLSFGGSEGAQKANRPHRILVEPVR